MQVLYDNLDEDSASTFSSVFSSSSSSFRSSDSDRVDEEEEEFFLDESSPPLPPTVEEANALFERNLNALVDRPKRVQARRVSFVEAREPSLNHDVEEISSLTHSAADTALEVAEVAAAAPAPKASRRREDEICTALSLPELKGTAKDVDPSRCDEPASPSGSVSSIGIGAVEQVAVNQARALSVKSLASLLSAKTLAEYRHLKYVLRQRLLRRYYDLWGRWAQRSLIGTPASHALQCASVSTQTLSVEHAALPSYNSPRSVSHVLTRGSQGDNEADPNWNADVESMETVSVAGSSLGRQSISPHASLSRGSSPASGGRTFSFPAPLPEPERLGATSRPSRLLDYGLRSDHPRPKGPQSLSQPSTGLPSVVEDPLRVVRIV